MKYVELYYNELSFELKELISVTDQKNPKRSAWLFFSFHFLSVFISDEIVVAINLMGKIQLQKDRVLTLFPLYLFENSTISLEL